MDTRGSLEMCSDALPLPLGAETQCRLPAETYFGQKFCSIIKTIPGNFYKNASHTK